MEPKELSFYTKQAHQQRIEKDKSFLRKINFTYIISGGIAVLGFFAVTSKQQVLISESNVPAAVAVFAYLVILDLYTTHRAYQIREQAGFLANEESNILTPVISFDSLGLDALQVSFFPEWSKTRIVPLLLIDLAVRGFIKISGTDNTSLIIYHQNKEKDTSSLPQYKKDFLNALFSTTDVVYSSFKASPGTLPKKDRSIFDISKYISQAGQFTRGFWGWMAFWSFIILCIPFGIDLTSFSNGTTSLPVYITLVYLYIAWVGTITILIKNRHKIPYFTPVGIQTIDALRGYMLYLKEVPIHSGTLADSDFGFVVVFNLLWDWEANLSKINGQRAFPEWYIPYKNDILARFATRIMNMN